MLPCYVGIPQSQPKHVQDSEDESTEVSSSDEEELSNEVLSNEVLLNKVVTNEVATNKMAMNEVATNKVVTNEVEANDDDSSSDDSSGDELPGAKPATFELAELGPWQDESSSESSSEDEVEDDAVVQSSGVKRSFVKMSTDGQVPAGVQGSMVIRKVPRVVGGSNSVPVVAAAPCVEYAFIRDLASKIFQTLGSGFSEAVYQKALSNDLSEHRISHEMERIIPVLYKGLQVGSVRADIVVQNAMVVELKRVAQITSAHLQQAQMYARLLRVSKIIVINFPCVEMALVQVCAFSEDGVWANMPSSPQS